MTASDDAGLTASTERNAYATDAWAMFYHRRWGKYADDVAPAIRAFYDAQALAATERSLLDVCCGTGHLAAGFLDDGYDVVGVDLSEPMIQIARRVYADAIAAGQAAFVVADATDFSVARPAGLAVSTYDALNLLPGLAELRACFASVARAVVPGGYFVFDVNTRRGFREDWTGCLVEESEDDFLFVQGLYDGDRHAQAHYAGFVRDGGGPWLRFEENLVGYAFETGEVIDALLDTGWESAWSADIADLSQPLSGAREPARLHVVARRAADR